MTDPIKGKSSSLAGKGFGGATSRDSLKQERLKKTPARSLGKPPMTAEEKDMVRAMLSEALIAVISQSLLKLKDGSGRCAAHEIMLGTPAIRNLIRENKIAQMYSAIQTSQSSGMQTLDQCLSDMVRRNMVSASEARGYAKIPENFPG